MISWKKSQPRFKHYNAKAPEKGGARKSRAAKAGDWLEKTRQAWEQTANRALENEPLWRLLRSTPVRSLLPRLVEGSPGVGARQRTQRQQPRHEAQISVRFAGLD